MKKFVLLFMLSNIADSFALDNKLNLAMLDNGLNRCYPKILNSVLQQEINKSKTKQTQSPFDTKLNAYAQQRAGSTYNTSYQKIEFEKRFYDSPISAYTGFDISSGYTPQYDSAQITSTQGRQFVGLKFNLLNGFAIDKDRLELYNAMIEEDKAKYEVELAKLLIKTDALKAYIGWLVAGYEMQAYQKLLDIAEKRQKKLESRLKHGDISEIAVKENYNYILKRKVKLMSAKDYFNQYSQSLSVYARNASCDMMVLDETMLPKKLPSPVELNETSSEKEINSAITNRPEFKIIDTQLQQIRNRQKLASTDLLPKLNLNVQYNQNNSDTTSTSYFRLNQQEGVAKLDFSLPLERRYATGTNEEVSNNLRKLQNERQLLIDQISSKLQALKFTVNNTASQLQISKDDYNISNQLLKAEEVKFMNGDSNFFMINAREENVTNSYLTLLSNLSDNYKSYIEYNFLNGQNVNLTNIQLEGI